MSKKGISFFSTVVLGIFIFSLINYLINYHRKENRFIEYKYLATSNKVEREEGINYFSADKVREGLALKAYLLDSDNSVEKRSQIILTIGQMNKTYLRAVLLELIHINDDRLRSDVGWTLCRYRDLQDRDFLNLADIFKNDKSLLVRRTLAISFLDFQSKNRVADIFSNGLTDKDGKIRMISEIGDYHFSSSAKAEEFIGAIVRNGSPSSKISLTAAIVELPDQKFDPFLKILAKDKDKNVRDEIIKCLSLRKDGNLSLGAAEE